MGRYREIHRVGGAAPPRAEAAHRTATAALPRLERDAARGARRGAAGSAETRRALDAAEHDALDRPGQVVVVGAQLGVHGLA